MSSKIAQDLIDTIIDSFKQRTKGSSEWAVRANRVLPGGDTRSSTFYIPYPAYMERGEGCTIYDYDENRYIDLLNNYTSLIHGHAHPDTVSAVREQVARGSVLGSTARITVEHAEMLCGRVPSLELVRYCNSGTEATLLATRAARAFTGKDLIVKMDGGYNGSHDYVQVNVQPDLEASGRPQRKVTSRGVPAMVLDGVRVVPFNDLDALEDVLGAYSEEIAAIILEPVLGAGGGVQPEPGYLQGVKQVADKHGVLLIFDEILTSRLDVGGLQAVYGVIPDLTTMGKYIAGGLPIGAFGGRKDIMDPFDPKHPQTIPHSGTFNGNNITMAAGLATMADYGSGEVARINNLGQRLKNGFNQAFQSSGVKARASGMGSIIAIHWTDEDVKTSRDAVIARGEAGMLPRLLHMALMNRGVFCAPRCQFTVSTPMSQLEIDQVVDVFGEALNLLDPYISEEIPHMLSG